MHATPPPTCSQNSEASAFRMRVPCARVRGSCTIVLPGTHVRGIALDARTGPPWRGEEGFSISLGPNDGEWLGAFTLASIDILGVPDDRVDPTIRPDEFEVPLAVAIGIRAR